MFAQAFVQESWVYLSVDWSIVQFPQSLKYAFESGTWSPTLVLIPQTDIVNVILNFNIQFVSSSTLESLESVAVSLFRCFLVFCPSISSLFPLKTFGKSPISVEKISELVEVHCSKPPTPRSSKKKDPPPWRFRPSRLSLHRKWSTRYDTDEFMDGILIKISMRRRSTTRWWQLKYLWEFSPLKCGRFPF